MTLVTTPGVDEVTLTTIVHPPGGTAVPDAIVMSVAVLVTPRHVPVLDDVTVIPAGIGSVKGTVSTSGPVPALPIVIVSVAVPPGTTRPGTIDFASDATPVPPVTVSGALAGGALPASVASVPVVLVTVPVVDDVMVTTIVQPPTGIVEPLALVMVVGVTVTAEHVPVLPLVVVTPAGMTSVNGAVSAIGAALVLPSVSVSVAVPPAAMVAGAMAFASVGSASTVSGALAGGAEPPVVVSGPVVLVTVPTVDEVIATTIVQPPTGTVEPLAIVTVVGVTVTPVHVPVLPPVVVTPAGIVSTNGAVRVNGDALVLASVSVSVAVPPVAMVAGAIVFATPAVEAVTVSGALAGGVVPAWVVRTLVVLVTVPTVVDVTVTTIVQPPTGMLVPFAIVIVVGVTVTPVHVPVLPLVVVTPAGIASVNGAVSVIAAAFVLPSVMVIVAMPPDGIVAGAIVLASDAAVAVTTSGALAGGAVPPSVTSGLVVLVTDPGVLEVIGTTIVQPPDGTCDPVAMVMSVGVVVTPGQVPVFAPLMVTPEGIASVKGD